jgi:hypothetical protein
MAKPDFGTLYNEALTHQKAGNLTAMTQLLKKAYTAGLPADELRMLGAIAESTIQFARK